MAKYGKKADRMRTVSAFIYLILVIVSEVVTAKPDSTIARDSRETETKRVRYIKDDGVDRLGFDEVQQVRMEPEEQASKGAAVKSDEDTSEEELKEIFIQDSNVKERDENDTKEVISNGSNKEFKQVVEEMINRNSRLKELERKQDSKQSSGVRSNSEEVRERTKERKVIRLDDSESTSSESRSLKQSGVPPFFIAEDGKSIQLPQSDVIYNTQTGEILIRKRITDRIKTDDSELGSVEDKGPHSKTYSIQTDGAVRNLQGFVIGENEGSVRPYLYPVTVASKEIESSERSTRLRNSSKNIHEEAEDKEIDEEEKRKVQKQAKAYNDSKSVEEEMEDRRNSGEHQDYLTKKEEHEMERSKSNNFAPILDEEQIAAIQTSTESYIPTARVHRTNEIKNTEPLVSISTEKYASAENSRNGKHAGSRNNDRGFESQQSSYEQSHERHQTPRVEDDTVYSIPSSAERSYDSRRTNKRPEDVYENDDIVDPNIYQDRLQTKTSSAEEVRSKVNEYDQRHYDSDHLLVMNGDEPNKNPAPLEDASVSKESGIVYSTMTKQNTFDGQDNPALNMEEHFGLSNEDISRRIGEEGIVRNESVLKAQKYALTTTTTEKPEPLEALRSYLEDIYLRGPIAIVVDVEPRNLMRTRELWTAMEAEGGILNITDAVLFGYDADGITSMSYHKGAGANRVDTDTKSLGKALYGMTTTTKYYSGPGNPRVALTKAAQLLPYDSAVFLFEADWRDGQAAVSGPPPKLIKQLLTKRIKLYSVSGSSAWSTAAATSSGGAAVTLDRTVEARTRMQTRGLRALTAYYDTSDEEELVFDEKQIIVQLKGQTEKQNLTIPVDSSVRSLLVNVTGSPNEATLHGPEGIQVDLLNASSVTAFSVGSKSEGKGTNVLISLVLVKSTPEDEELQGQSEPFHGLWHLVTSSDGPYNVIVKAETNLRIMTRVVPFFTDGGAEESFLKIAVGGSVAILTDAELIDDKGQTIVDSNRTKFKEDSSTENDVTEIESLRALESGTVVRHIKIPEELDAGMVFRIKVTGKNDRDEQFVRISKRLTAPDDQLDDVELLQSTTEGTNASHLGETFQRQSLPRGLGSIDEGRSYNTTSNGQVFLANRDGVPMTAIQLGPASRLYGAPGTQMQIHFEVTNNRENAVYFRFGAKDDQYFLRSMLPLRQWINAGQTANVVVTVGITSTAGNNVRDTITFTASGLETTMLNAIVYVETDGHVSSDRNRPNLRHEYRSDCLGYLSTDSCSGRTWSMDVFAKDTESGLMRIAVSPGSVRYQQGFYAGSREEASARFTATCCTQAVVLSAIDVAGNVASYETNVANYLTPATIVAIVLGILLFIVLIVVIVLLIRMCVRRKRASRDLPSYQTQRAA